MVVKKRGGTPLTSTPPADVRPIAADWSQYLEGAIDSRNDRFISEYRTQNIRFIGNLSGSDSAGKRIAALAGSVPIHLDPFTVEAIRVAELAQMSGGEFAIVLPTASTAAAVPMAVALLMRYGETGRLEGLPAHLAAKFGGHFIHRPGAKVLVVSDGIELRTLYLNVATKGSVLADYFGIGHYSLEEGKVVPGQWEFSKPVLKNFVKGGAQPRIVFCSHHGKLGWHPHEGFTAAIFEHGPGDSAIRTSQLLEFARKCTAELKIHIVALPTSPAAVRLASRNVPMWMWSPDDIARLLKQEAQSPADRSLRFSQSKDSLTALSRGSERRIEPVDYGDIRLSFKDAAEDVASVSKHLRTADYLKRLVVQDSYQLLSTLANLAVPVSTYNEAAKARDEWTLDQAVGATADRLSELDAVPSLNGASGRLAGSLGQIYSSLKRKNPKAIALTKLVVETKEDFTVVGYSSAAAGAIQAQFPKPGPVTAAFFGDLHGAINATMVYTGLPASRDIWRLGTVFAPKVIFLEEPAGGRLREMVRAFERVSDRSLPEGLRLEFVSRLAEGERKRHRVQTPRPLVPPPTAATGPISPAPAATTAPAATLPSRPGDAFSFLLPDEETAAANASPSAIGGLASGATVPALGFTFEDGSRLLMKPRATMTKDVPGQGASSVLADQLEAGSRVFVFREGARQNLFGSILERAETHSMLKAHKDNIRFWQERLLEWLGPTPAAIQSNLAVLSERFQGRKELSTLEAWAMGERIGPKTREDLLFLARTIEDKQLEKRIPDVWASIAKMRQLHTVVGFRISQALGRLAGSARDDDTYIDKDLGITVEDFLGSVSIRTISVKEHVMAPSHLIGIYRPAGEA